MALLVWRLAGGRCGADDVSRATSEQVETYQIKNGWGARNPILRLAAHGATEEEAKENLVVTEAAYFVGLNRAEALRKKRIAELLTDE